MRALTRAFARIGWAAGVCATLLAWGCVTSETTAPVSARTLLREADALFVTSDTERALGHYKLCADAALGEKDDVAAAEACAQLALIHAMRGEVGDARAWLRRAADHAREGEPLGWSRTLLARGACAQAEGDTLGASESYALAFDFSRRHHLAERAVQAAHLAAVSTEGEERVSWARRAVAVAEERGNARWLADLWANLGWIQDEQGRLVESLASFRAAREQAALLGDEHALVRADWSLARALRRSGERSEAERLAARTLARAEDLYRHFRRPNDAEWVGRCERELGELAAEEGDGREALRRLGIARERFVEAGIETLAPDQLAELDQRIGEVRRTLVEDGGAP